MTDAAHRLMTAEEFLEWCEHQEERYELVDGVPILKFDNGPESMAGASQAHDQIVINLIAFLRPALRPGPCRVRSSDQAARMVRGNIRRPDVTIDCGPRDRASFESSEPTVLFEVLSPSTRRIDLLRKVDEYQHLPTLKQFVMLEPDRPWAIVWSRDPEGGWSSEVVDSVEGALHLSSVGLTVPMATAYEDADLPE